MTKWFVQQDESQEDIGPLKPSELLEMVRSGKVTSDSMLRKDDSNWFVAGEWVASSKPQCDQPYVIIAPSVRSKSPNRP